MNKLFLLAGSLILSSSIYANFFSNIMPTPERMVTFYNNNTVGMLPVFDREKRLENQFADSVFDGEVIHLSTPTRDVFSIFMEAEEETDTGVILLHTRGEHPNEENLIKPLRVDIAERGYHTLSVQMPVLEKTAKYYDYVPIFVYSHPRIRAAIDFYKNMGVKNIVFVAHGCGAHMLMSYLDLYGDRDINAVIGIGMGATDTGQTVVRQYPLDRINTPVLDIIGQFDYPSTKKHAKTRVSLLRENAQQAILPKAKHYHRSEKEFEQLTNTISDWLEVTLQ